MASQKAVLRNRAALLGALIFCTYEALPTALTSVRAVRQTAPLAHDPVYVLALMVCLAASVSVAIRSSFVGDRVVFGAAAGAFVLWLVTAVISPGPVAMRVINRCISVIWAIAAVASFIILIHISRRRISS